MRNVLRRWLLRHIWAIHGPLRQLMRGRWFPLPDEISAFTPAEFEAYIEWIGLGAGIRASKADLARRTILTDYTTGATWVIAETQASLDNSE